MTKKHKYQKTKKHFFLQDQAGFSAMPLILMTGGLIVQIAVTLTVSNFLLNNSEFGARLSSLALESAYSGINDAYLKIVRDKSFTSAGYSLSVGGNSVDIVVCKDSPPPTCAGAGYQRISATGRTLNSGYELYRKLEAVVNVDSVTGEAILQSIGEVAL